MSAPGMYSRLTMALRRPAANAEIERRQATNAGPITTNVIGALGPKVLYMDLHNDPCICVTLLQQNRHHGNCVMPSSSETGLPICRAVEIMSLVELVRYCTAMFEAYGCIAATVGDKGQWQMACELWAEDMKVTEGIAKGLPNSQELGIQRAHGIAYGRFAHFLRSLSPLRKLWRAAAMAFGRDPLGPETEWLTSFDGTLATTNDHDYKGLLPHIDVEMGEPGHITALAVLHPPSRGFRRVGQAIQWYKNTLPLWRQQGLGLLTKWSMSPDMDLRTTPYPNLGSGGHNGKVLGGDVMSKDAALKLSDEDLLEAISKLPAYLQESFPPKPAADDRTDAAWLLDHGWIPVKPDAERLAMDADPRGAFIRAIAFGMAASSARKFFSPNIVDEGLMVLKKARDFSAPEKLELWRRAGGRHGRKPVTILQPSGAVGKKRKKNGNVKALSSRRPKTMWR